MAMKIETERIRECLNDADCPEEMAKTCMAMLENGDAKDAVRLLRQHRGKLLERKHEDERRIDCLDYLVYQLKKTEE